MAKIIRSNNFRAAIEGTAGNNIYRQFMPWLKDIANEQQEPMTQVNKWAKWARSGSTLMSMGYKITTIATQFVGATQSISYLGTYWFGAGCKTVYSDMYKLPELYRQTVELSPFMADRIASFDREVKDMSGKLMPGGAYSRGIKTFRDNAFVPMGVAQLGVDLPTWWGAYHKSMHENGLDEVRAVAEADAAVRMSQGSGRAEDLSSVQRGGELQRLFTMFYSYFNTLYNLCALKYKEMGKMAGPEAVLHAAKHALLLWFIPAVLSELVAGRGPDDDEEAWKWTAQNIMGYPFQAVIGVRDLANAIFSEFDYKITPASGSPQALARWVKELKDFIGTGDTDKLLKSSVQALGFAARLPIGQAIISIENMWSFINGDDPDFYIRDLVYTKPQSRR